MFADRKSFCKNTGAFFFIIFGILSKCIANGSNTLFEAIRTAYLFLNARISEARCFSGSLKIFVLYSFIYSYIWFKRISEPREEYRKV